MAGLLLWGGPTVSAAELKPKAIEAFDRYVAEFEQRFEERLAGQRAFLWSGESQDRQRQVRQGRILVEPAVGKGDAPVPGGLLHHWLASAFVEGATLASVLQVVQDYDRHKAIYGREVTDSRLLDRCDDDFRVYLRLRKKKIVAVVLETEHQAYYRRVGPRRWYSRSHSTRIAEVKNPGDPDETLLPVGNDHGFLWRLNSYWRFEETAEGVFVETEVVALTRGVPFGLGWLIRPIMRSLPRESLTDTLTATRSALVETLLAGQHAE